MAASAVVAQQGQVADPTQAPAQAGILVVPQSAPESEKVGLEKTRLSAETRNMILLKTELKNDILNIQKDLAFGSIYGAGPASVNFDEYRTYLSADPADIEQQRSYYELQQKILDDLTPINPLRRTREEADAQYERALANFEMLQKHPADAGISRDLQSQINAIIDGRRTQNAEVQKINEELKKELKVLENLEHTQAYGMRRSSLRPRETNHTPQQLAARQKQIEESKAKIERLRNQVWTQTDANPAKQRIQFQQLIVSLALQQRYLHSLVASAWYRKWVKSGDLEISRDAWPTRKPGENHQSPPMDSSNPSPNASPKTQTPGPADYAGLNLNLGELFVGPDDVVKIADLVPVFVLQNFDTIPSMEAGITDILNRGRRDAAAIGNMLKANQLAAAEAKIREVNGYSRHQPELHLISYEDRQRVLKFGQNINRISTAVRMRDYDVMVAAAGECEAMANDLSLDQVRHFANKYLAKARGWADMAGMAMQLKQLPEAGSFMEAARDLAPTDQIVMDKLAAIQNRAVGAAGAADQLQIIADAKDYRALASRASEFAPYLNEASDPVLKTKIEELQKLEQTVLGLVIQCQTLEAVNSHPDIWIALQEADPALEADPRLLEWKSKTMSKCPTFIHAYSEGRKNEKASQPATALAWYLTAQREAPSSMALRDRITSLGNQLVNQPR